MTPYQIGHITIEPDTGFSVVGYYLTIKDEYTDRTWAVTKDELRDLRLILNTIEEDKLI